MVESLYFRWIRERNAVVEECGGWGEYLAKVERIMISARLGLAPADPLVDRIADLETEYWKLIEGMNATVGTYRIFRHADKRNGGTLVEVELSNGDSFLGYDLLDALEQAADSRREKPNASITVNHADRTPQREAGRCEANR